MVEDYYAGSPNIERRLRIQVFQDTIPKPSSQKQTRQFLGATPFPRLIAHFDVQEKKIMDTDLSTFELALLRTERDIAGADDEMASLEAEIVRMRAEIARIAKQRAGYVDLSIELKKRLGKELPEATRSGVELDEDASVRLVARNAFKGMTPAKATRKYLLEIGHGISHPVLVKVLLRGNVKCGSKNASDVMRTALHRHKEWFVWRKEKGQRGIWELVEWQTQAEDTGAHEAAESRVSGAAPALSLVNQASSAAGK